MNMKVILSIIENNWCLTDMRCFWGLGIFYSKIEIFSICSSVQTINSVPFSRLQKYSFSSIRVPSGSKNKWRLIIFICFCFPTAPAHLLPDGTADGLNHFAGHTKKVVYVFHSNGNSFDMIDVYFPYNNLTKNT